MGGVFCRSVSEGDSAGASEHPNATTNGNKPEAETQQTVTPGQSLAYKDSFSWFDDEEIQQLLADELPLAEAKGPMEHLAAIPPRLTSLLFASVERAGSICAAYDGSGEAEPQLSPQAGDKALPSTREAAHIASVIRAAEEARMHSWALAGCDTLLKLLVATAVQIAKRRELFSADAHASFL